MKISEALKNLAVAVAGSGEAEDITEEKIADIIQYIADNWPAEAAGVPMCCRQPHPARWEV